MCSIKPALEGVTLHTLWKAPEYHFFPMEQNEK
jgi:hypothetical protein